MLDYMRAFHLLFTFVWIGNLLALTRLMGYHVKEEERVQMRMAKIYKRMYNFVELPCMILAIVMGIGLLVHIPLGDNIGWLYLKFAFVTGLVGCDLVCGHFVKELNQQPDTSRGIKYKILHGVTGLMLIGILLTVYVVHGKNNEKFSYSVENASNNSTEDV